MSASTDSNSINLFKEYQDDVEEHSFLHLRVGAAEDIGDRSTMEDTYKIITDFCQEEWNIPFAQNLPRPIGYFGVFDGHDGPTASLFVRDNLHRHLKDSLNDLDVQNAEEEEEALNLAFSKAFNKTDAEFLVDEREKGHSRCDFSGSAGIVVKVLGNRIIVANAGDCRAILARNESTIALSLDHRLGDDEEVWVTFERRPLSSSSAPSICNLDEVRRVKAAGGWISEGRLNGCLQTVRGFGDIDFKDFKDRIYRRHKFTADLVIAEPDVRHYTLQVPHPISLNDQNSYGFYSPFLPQSDEVNSSTDSAPDFSSSSSSSSAAASSFSFSPPPGDRFMVIATDGLWDVLSNEDVTAFLDQQFSQQIQCKLSQLLQQSSNNNDNNSTNNGHSENSSTPSPSSSSSESLKMSLLHPYNFIDVQKAAEKLIEHAKSVSNRIEQVQDNITVVVIAVLPCSDPDHFHDSQHSSCQMCFEPVFDLSRVGHHRSQRPRTSSQRRRNSLTVPR